MNVWRKLALVLCLLLVSCSLPAPNVGPGPAPDPAPVVVKVHSLWIITVFGDSSTQDQAALLGDLEYWQSLVRRGHKWRSLHTEDPAAQKYQAQIMEAKEIPCIILLDASKTPSPEIAAEKLPADKAAVDALIAQWSDK